MLANLLRCLFLHWLTSFREITFTSDGSMVRTLCTSIVLTWLVLLKVIFILKLNYLFFYFSLKLSKKIKKHFSYEL